MAKTIIGIMGPGEKATPLDLDNAHQVASLVAKAGYVVMTGARPIGVMEAALRGAKEAGGETIGIIPSKAKGDASNYADFVIVTGMNSARNFINALTSDVMIACGVEAGTLSEIALALKEKKNVVLMTHSNKAAEFLQELNPDLIHVVENAEQAFAAVNKVLALPHAA